jgi:hypothetical protein
MLKHNSWAEALLRTLFQETEKALSLIAPGLQRPPARQKMLDSGLETFVCYKLIFENGLIIKNGSIIMRKSIYFLVILGFSFFSGCIPLKQRASETSHSTITAQSQDQTIPGGSASDLSDRTFTLAVWLQEAVDKLNDKTLARNYKDIGINTYAGLWMWPAEDWAWKGYSVLTAQALKDAGIKAYAGNDRAAVDWITNHPEFHDTIIGYLLGDEPDMNRNSGIKSVGDANIPVAWKAMGDALRALDNKRPVYANFGKPFSKDVWYKTENGAAGSTKERDFALYVAPTSVISSDFYGITDPYEPPENHGVWTYGRAVRNTIKYAGGRPVWGFVETSGPWRDATSKNWMCQKMPPSLIMPIVWNMIINGASGIAYFCHDFSPGPSNKGKYAALLEPGMPEAIKSANESVMRYGAVLKVPDVPGTVVKSGGDVNVITLTKKFKGITYIFAMGDGNSNYRDGLAVDAKIIVRGETGVKNVTVLNDSRTITMTNGVITDHFKPYELHIYRINNPI